MAPGAALTAADCIRVPAVAGFWVEEALDRAVLPMEWLDLAPAPMPGVGAGFCRQLCALHRHAAPSGDGRFGWWRDNGLGITPPRTRWSDGGASRAGRPPIAHERLRAMAGRLSAAGHAPALAYAVGHVIDALPRFFDDGHVPRASLVHGDLWSGNWGRLPGGAPVIFDPAVSASDDVPELAMMELLGTPRAGCYRIC